MNASRSREEAYETVMERVMRTLHIADGLEACGDLLERASLPRTELEEVRSSVVARLRADAIRARVDAAHLTDRLDDIAAAQRAAETWHRHRP